MGRAVPVLIGFLASLLGIGGLADKVLSVIRKIRQRIENAIVKFWNFVKGKAKGLLGRKNTEKKGKSDSKELDNDKVDSFKSIKVEFEDEADKDTHHAYYKGKDLIIESTPTRIEHLFINKNSEARENNNEELLKILI